MAEKLIPEMFKEDFRAEMARRFWFRTNLFCYITIFSFLAVGVLAFVFFRGIFYDKGFPGTIAGGVIFPVVILLTSSRPKLLARQKGRAFFFSFLLILVTILIAAAHPEIVRHLGATLVLLSFFTGVLLLPWNALETLIIGALTIANFTWIYRMAGTDVNAEVFAVNIILLFIAAFVAAVVKRNEEVLLKKEFVEHRELEVKNGRIARELDLANRIHKGLIPHSARHELADIAVTYVPMLYMGGDYANYKFIGKDKLLFMVADMTGHGVSSALLVNRMDTEIERLISHDTPPGDMLKSLDDFIKDDFGRMGYYLSVFAGLLDFSGKELIYSSYGHPPQMLLRSKDGQVVDLEPQTFLMGINLETRKTYSTSVPFEKGDRVVLFTDGILDAKDSSGEFYGSERLERFSRENGGLEVSDFNNKLLKDVRDFRSGEQGDDIFLMTIQTK